VPRRRPRQVHRRHRSNELKYRTTATPQTTPSQQLHLSPSRGVEDIRLRRRSVPSPSTFAPPQSAFLNRADDVFRRVVAPTRQIIQQVSPRAANPFQPNPKPVTFRVEVESETSKLLRRVSADSHAGQSTFSPMLDPAQDDTFVDRAVAGVEDDEPSSFFDQTLPRDTLRFDSGPTRDKVLSHESSASDDEDHLEEQSDERVGVDAPEIAAEDDIVLEDTRRSPTPEFIRDSEHDQDVEMIAVDALILVKVAPVKAAKAAASRPRVVESKSRARITAMDVDVREPVDDSGIFFEDDVVAARDSLIDAGSPQGASLSCLVLVIHTDGRSLCRSLVLSIAPSIHRRRQETNDRLCSLAAHREASRPFAHRPPPSLQECRRESCSY
jgi:hypothetical protein